MRFLGSFDQYFVMLNVVLGLVLILIDFKKFKKSGNEKEAKYSKIIGIFLIAISIVLYITAAVLT